MKKERFDAYANYYYKTNIKKNLKTKLLTMLFVVFSLVVVIFFSISFSNFLVVAKIVNVNSNYILEDKTLYAISFKSFSAKNEAETYALDLKKQGGAGYIYSNAPSVYYVLSSVYFKEEDAKKVKSNLQDSLDSVEIIKIKMPAFNLKINLSTNSTDILSESVNIFYSTYKELYNLSIEYDANDVDLINLKKSLNDKYKENKNLIDKFKNNFNATSNVYILYTKIYLEKANKHLEELINLDESNNISSEIKCCYCKVINSYLELCNQMI